MHNLKHQSAGDAIHASDWNQIVDYVNGPGQYQNGGYFATDKGTLLQRWQPYSTNDAGKLPTLLECSIQRHFDYDLSTENLYYFLQLGADIDSTLNSFSLYGENIDVMLLINRYDKDRDHIVLSDEWILPNQGLLNTYINPLSSPGVRGEFWEAKISCDSGGLAELSGSISSINYLLLTDGLSVGDDYSARLSAYALSSADRHWHWVTSEREAYFDIAKFTESLSSRNSRYNFKDMLSAILPQLIQMHIGGLHYGGDGEKLKLPWMVNPKTMSIERPYVQVGTTIFNSNIISTDISGDNYLRVNIDDLSCELCATPFESANIMSFKMFNVISSGNDVEYYNIMPIVPVWERYLL